MARGAVAGFFAALVVVVTLAVWAQPAKAAPFSVVQTWHVNVGVTLNGAADDFWVPAPLSWSAHELWTYPITTLGSFGAGSSVVAVRVHVSALSSGAYLNVMPEPASGTTTILATVCGGCDATWAYANGVQVFGSAGTYRSANAGEPTYTASVADQRGLEIYVSPGTATVEWFEVDYMTAGPTCGGTPGATPAPRSDLDWCASQGSHPAYDAYALFALVGVMFASASILGIHLMGKGQ